MEYSSRIRFFDKLVYLWLCSTSILFNCPPT